jgi:hypothetical protein
VSHDRASAQHITDEDLLLDYYGEGSAETRAVMRAHLDTCADCRMLDHELRGVLALVDAEPAPDAPEGFERELWARLEPQIAQRHPAAGVATGFVRAGGWSAFTRALSLDLPRWAFAAGAVALALGSFTLGRSWEARPEAPAESAADTQALSERLLRTEVEEHLERSQRVLMELVNADDAAPVVLASDRARAADLVADGRLYRRSFEVLGDTDTRDLLEDVERVLVEIANGPPADTSKDLSGVRARISDQDLIFRLRMMTAEMQERERRARSTW